MHYATLPLPNAHPHQVILQWLAEWGLPATLLACALVLMGMRALYHRLRQPSAGVLDAGVACAIVAALLLAQVSGVFVMPYTETWLALLIGLALARGRESPSMTPVRWQWLPALLCAAAVSWTLLHDVPGLPEDQQRYLDEHRIGWHPRFWLQGHIPMALGEDPSAASGVD